MAVQSTRWINGFGFTEGPRWHDGQLWFSDFGDGLVRRVDADGHATEMARVSGRPSGLGWLPDDTLLVVSMNDRAVLRVREGAATQHADLSGFAEFSCNDMVVDAKGNAY